MNEFDYYNEVEKRRNTVQSEKSWDELPFSKSNSIILLKAKKINPIEEKFNEVFKDA